MSRGGARVSPERAAHQFAIQRWAINNAARQLPPNEFEMKFSILTLFAATGYFALVFVALTQPSSLWKYVAGIAWLAILAYLLILATDTIDRASSRFGRVALACIVVYFALTALGLITRETEPRRLWSVLPHQWATFQWTNSAYYKSTKSADRILSVRTPINTIEPLIAYNTALLFGLATGTVSAIRHRRQLRQASSQSPVRESNAK